MENTTEFQWESAAHTDVGLARARNEDAWLATPGLWVVADGMGGHALGDFASRSIVEALTTLSLPGDLDQAIDDTRAVILGVNQLLMDEARQARVRVIGSTVVALLARGHQCACLWAGDSRLYLLRDNHLQQLTRDHSHVEQLRARGLITAEEAKHHPAHNAITRAVGAAATLDLETLTLDVRDGDMFLLCSDGLYNDVDDTDIASVLASGDCRHAADELLRLALAHGGQDNVTVVVIRAIEADGSSESSSSPDTTG